MRLSRGLLLLLMCAPPGEAHVGSPDVFFEGEAGPYKLLVTVRPPNVIPGVAQVEIRSLSPGVREIRILPMPLTGEGTKHPPTPDFAQASKDDPQFYTGTVWLMAFGSWQVRVEADGTEGKGQIAVPVPALASNIAGMQKQLCTALFGIMLFLVAGLVSIVGAGVREARLGTGLPPPLKRRRASYVAMGITALLVAGVLFAGDRWWDSDAAAYRGKVYKPPQMTARLEGESLRLELADSGLLSLRQFDDLVPDHNHLMHLFAIRMPEMDRMWHLHPDQGDPGIFAIRLPSMVAGSYKLFADIVHENGLAETATAELRLPDITGRELSGDDGAGVAAPLSHADAGGKVFDLPDGFHMVWLRDPGTIPAKRTTLFRFELQDAIGQPARDMEPYMGMAGHAEFVRSDGNVFAHVHPAGSVSMAALAMTQAMAGMHLIEGMRTPATVSFPYGFPSAGRYRIFVQMKRAGEVETGVFDVNVP